MFAESKESAPRKQSEQAVETNEIYRLLYHLDHPASHEDFAIETDAIRPSRKRTKLRNIVIGG